MMNKVYDAKDMVKNYKNFGIKVVIEGKDTNNDININDAIYRVEINDDVATIYFYCLDYAGNKVIDNGRVLTSIKKHKFINIKALDIIKLGEEIIEVKINSK